MTTFNLHQDNAFSIESLIVTLNFFKPLVKDQSKAIQSDTPLTQNQQLARISARIQAAVMVTEHLNRFLSEVIESDSISFNQESPVVKELKDTFDSFFELENKLHSVLNSRNVPIETPIDYLDTVSTYSSLVAELEGLVFQTESDDLDWDNLLSNANDEVEEWKPELA